MEQLEAVLNKIKNLKNDLSANLKEEEGHFHTVVGGMAARGCHVSGYDKQNYEEEEWVVDKSAVPDTNKRELARKQLQQIYESSDWYSARYYSGLIIWEYDEVNKLERRLNEPDISVITQRLRLEPNKQIEPWIREIEKRINNSDEKTAIEAIDDTKELFQLSHSSFIKELLKKAYRRNEFRSVRVTAGEF